MTMTTRKRHSPEQVVRKLASADRMLGEGNDVADVCRELRVSEQTYYRWRNQLGGLKAHDANRLKQLERENCTLKRLLADAELEKAALKGDRSGKLLSPECRRAAVHHLIAVMGVSQRFACRVTGPNRTTRGISEPQPRCRSRCRPARLASPVGEDPSTAWVSPRLSRRAGRGLDGESQENPAALA
jgi:transposase-like protein